jgi:hypothetical protein
MVLVVVLEFRREKDLSQTRYGRRNTIKII